MRPFDLVRYYSRTPAHSDIRRLLMTIAWDAEGHPHNGDERATRTSLLTFAKRSGMPPDYFQTLINRLVHSGELEVVRAETPKDFDWQGDVVYRVTIPEGGYE